ncbi:class I SAM-dependent methyltransferase [Roseicella aquatilis]|nr:class I SAM-dependent methyltransferase [Roseicella aquatilis]
MQVIRSIEELDARMEECDRAEAVSEAALHAVLADFRMDPPIGLPPDPFSEAYREAQFALFRDIAGRDPAMGTEASPPHRPLPEDSTALGERLMALGWLIRAMALPRGARVVTFGAGQGDAAIALARLGCEVIVVEADPPACGWLRRRAAQEGVEIDVVQGGFAWVEGCGRRFEAVLCHGSFHRCADPLRLLRVLRAALVPEGRAFFAAEPVSPDFPMPWGLRLDGASLRALRREGRLAFGFREDSFARALAAAGWEGQRSACADPALTLWEARPRGQPVFLARAGDPRLRSLVGRPERGAILLDGQAGTGLYGPYITLPAGTYLARLRLRDGGPGLGRASMDVACDTGRHILAERRIEPDLGADADGAYALPFGAAREMPAVEVRLFCEEGFRAAVEAVEIVRV